MPCENGVDFHPGFDLRAEIRLIMTDPNDVIAEWKSIQLSGAQYCRNGRWGGEGRISTTETITERAYHLTVACKMVTETLDLMIRRTGVIVRELHDLGDCDQEVARCNYADWILLDELYEAMNRFHHWLIHFEEWSTEAIRSMSIFCPVYSDPHPGHLSNFLQNSPLSQSRAPSPSVYFGYQENHMSLILETFGIYPSIHFPCIIDWFPSLLRHISCITVAAHMASLPVANLFPVGDGFGATNLSDSVEEAINSNRSPNYSPNSFPFSISNEQINNEAQEAQEMPEATG
jgi:hypothetical protein